jgi:hypothetical protein
VPDVNLEARRELAELVAPLNNGNRGSHNQGHALLLAFQRSIVIGTDER